MEEILKDALYKVLQQSKEEMLSDALKVIMQSVDKFLQHFLDESMEKDPNHLENFPKKNQWKYS